MPVALELGAQLLVVVDAAVEHQGQPERRVDHRLRAGDREVDDREPSVHQRHRAVRPDAVAVGAAVLEAATQPRAGRDVRAAAVEAQLTRQSAHSSLPRARSGPHGALFLLARDDEKRVVTDSSSREHPVPTYPTLGRGLPRARSDPHGALFLLARDDEKRVVTDSSSREHPVPTYPTLGRGLPRARSDPHGALFLLARDDEKRVVTDSSSREHPVPTYPTLGRGLPRARSGPHGATIQVSLAPPPRELLTTRLPSGAIRVRASPANRCSSGPVPVR